MRWLQLCTATDVTSCAARSPPQYAPPHLDFWPFDFEVGVGVACDLGYPCAKFRLPRPFGFRVRADVRDIRQTDGRTDGRTTDADDRLMPPPPLRGGGIIMQCNTNTHTLFSRKLRRMDCVPHFTIYKSSTNRALVLHIHSFVAFCSSSTYFPHLAFCTRAFCLVAFCPGAFCPSGILSGTQLCDAACWNGTCKIMR